MRMLDSMARAREDFRKRTGFYPWAFLLPPRAFRRLGRRRFKGALIRRDERLKTGEFTVMCGRAYETWRFQRMLKGLPC